MGCRVKYEEIWPQNKSEFERYMLGLIKGDGQVEDKRITITDGEKNFLEKIAKLVMKYLKLNPKIRKRKNVKAYTLRIYNKDYVKTVRANMTKEEIDVNFIRGFFDAEGTMYTYKQYLIIEMCSSNRKILEKISNALKQLKISSYIKRHKYFHKYRRKTYSKYILVIKRKESVTRFLRTIGLRHTKHLAKINPN